MGTKTLARGLDALFQVVQSPDGLTPPQLARSLDVDRAVAYRILLTLAERALVTVGEDGRFRTGAGLFALANQFSPHLRSLALPIMRDLANDQGATIALFLGEGEEVTAAAVVEPDTPVFHIAFHPGQRHSVHKASAGYAILSMRPQTGPEPAEVTAARSRGYAVSLGEVEPGAYGVAAPIATTHAGLEACFNLMTYREDVAKDAPAAVLKAAERLGKLLG